MKKIKKSLGIAGTIMIAAMIGMLSAEETAKTANAAQIKAVSTQVPGLPATQNPGTQEDSVGKLEWERNKDILNQISWNINCPDNYAKFEEYEDIGNGYHITVVIFLKEVTEEKKTEFLEESGISYNENTYYQIIYKKTQYSFKEMMDMQNAIKEVNKEHVLQVAWMTDSNVEEELKKGVFDANEVFVQRCEAVLSNFFYNEGKEKINEIYGDFVAVISEEEYRKSPYDFVLRSMDINKDGKEDLRDAQLVLKAAISLVKLTEAQRFDADRDKDLRITLKDAKQLLKGILRIAEEPKSVIKAVVTQAPLMPGDVNQDFRLDMKDAQLALRVALNLETVSENGLIAGDLNKNGVIDMEDAKMILKMVLNLS